MHPSTRTSAIIRNGVMAGSVWETRMKTDEAKGGIKVFNAAGESRDDEEGLRVYRRLRRNQSDGEKKKRKSWKQPEAQRSPIHLRKARSIGVEEKGVLLICDERGNEKEEEEQRRSFDDKEMDLPVERDMEVEEVKKIEEVHEIQVSPPPMVVVEDIKETDPDPAAAMSEGGEEEEEGNVEEILFETGSGSSNRMQHIGWYLNQLGR